MQINIDKKTGALLLIILALIGSIFILLVNKNSDPMDEMGSHSNHMMADNKLSGADVMFLQMMIPHHQQAVDISNLALTKSKDAELLALAKKIATDQALEITQMKAWLKNAGAGEDMGHSMSGMGGMLSDAQLANLEKVTGAEFDKAWLLGMVGHHDGAIHMTNMINDSQNPEIKKFGEAIVKNQTEQVTQMNAMLSRIK